jgi:anti-anti-sigma regulatory factor
MVALVKSRVCVKLIGRANYACSVDFKSLVEQLRQRGKLHFQLDLSECVTMDSTFLGVLAAFAQRLASAQPAPGQVELLDPSVRVSDLLDNLGVMDLFKVVSQKAPAKADYRQVEQTDPSKLELARTSLEAHQALMALSPGNVAKFKDVTRFLAEDLEKLEEAQQPDGAQGSG